LFDRDVRLKHQLEYVAQGVRSLFPTGSNPTSPYGDNWDVLWLGHCGEPFPETLEENRGKPAHDKFVIKNDATVPPFGKITGLVDWKAYPEFTRWVHRSAGPMCSFAYALSQAGARKVLFDLSVDRLNGAFDNALAQLCRNGVSSLGDPSGLFTNCASVTPPVFFHHKAKGFINRDSDIQNVADGNIREKGTTENIVWSARNNIRNMMMGTEMESQFEN
jgi:hypothetical protein